jgi:uncharacterized protein YjbI with pentapeptide repeats
MKTILKKASEKSAYIVRGLFAAGVCAGTLLIGTSLVQADLEKSASGSKCNGAFKERTPTDEELKALLDAHLEWLRTATRRPEERRFISYSPKADSRRLNLCGAKLRRYTKLRGAHMDGADLRGAVFVDVDLTFSTLEDADLTGADLNGAKMTGALLRGAVLHNASLTNTTLHEAHLESADLTDGDLLDVDLTEAILVGTRFSKATFYATDVRGAMFEPEDLPDINSLATAKNLSEMSWHSSPQSLLKLRRAFVEAGYRTQERAVTYAIKHSDLVRVVPGKAEGVGERIGRLFDYIFFELTTRWGMDPGRALWVLLGLIPVFAVAYVIALRVPGKNGIWRVWTDSRVRKDLGTAQPERLQVGWLAAIWLGLYFSVLSAFRIGWRELNVGNWIERLQTGEYTLAATGWARTVSGVQSLASVYLLAIWALTYFGRPFE